METDNTNIVTNDISNCEDCWLNNFAAFNNCSPHVKNQLVRNTKIKEYNKGESLINIGDIGGGIFCIQRGIVKVSKTGHKKQEFILWIAGRGDIIGLDSLIDDEPFSFSACAIDQVTACFILTQDLKMALKEDPIVSIQLMKNLCDKLNFIEQRITSISRKKIRARCAEIIISIATKSHSEGDNMFIYHSVKDLASLIGTTKSYLYKILLEFTNKNILSVHKGKLYINNMSELSSIAIEDDRKVKTSIS